MEPQETKEATIERPATPTSCPRCGADIAGADFYGICDRCASALRATYSGDPRSDVEAGEYEPKMNVTPNAIASKE